MRIKLKYVLIVVAACGSLVASAAMAGPRIVNCDEGDSLQEAIDAGAGSAKPVDIVLSGNCYENIGIQRDGVSIVGDYDATIIGRVRLFSADNIYLENLKLTGPLDGLVVVDGRARLMNVHIAQNEGAGVYAHQNGTVALINCLVEDNAGPGIILDNSSSRVRLTTIQRNGGGGIQVTNNGSLVFDDGAINYHDNGSGIRATNSSSINVANSHIGWNNPVGIGLSLGSSGIVTDTDANANVETGVFVDTNSALEFNGGNMSWNGLYGGWSISHSLLVLHGVNVGNNAAHGIVVQTDSALFAHDDTRIEFNMAGDMVQIECRDKESSIVVDPSVVIDPYEINCPDPDF